MVQEMRYMTSCQVLKTVERDPVMTYNQPGVKISIETSSKLKFLGDIPRSILLTLWELGLHI